MTSNVAPGTRRARHDSERGSVTLEVAILTPFLVLLFGALVLAGRVQVAAGVVEHAARSAARDASLAHTADAARTAAQRAADRELAAAQLSCQPSTTVIDTTGFARRTGQPATVRVTVTCAVDIADLAVPGLPGTRTLTGDAASPLDRYRSR